MQQVEVDINQWKYQLSPEEMRGTNRQAAHAGPKAGEEINAFYELVAKLGSGYGAPIFIQEPSLRVGVDVTVLKKDKTGYLKDGNGDFQTEIVSKPLVGFVIRNEQGTNIEGRGSWSNLAIFSKKDYSVDPKTHVLTIEGAQYQCISYMEPDKNRMEGIVGVYERIQDQPKKSVDQVPMSYELEDLAVLLMPRNLKELNETVKARG